MNLNTFGTDAMLRYQVRHRMRQIKRDDRAGATVSQGVRDSFWRQGMQAGMPASVYCIKAFSDTDLTTDLKGLNYLLNELAYNPPGQKLGFDDEGGEEDHRGPSQHLVQGPLDGVHGVLTLPPRRGRRRTGPAGTGW